MSINRKQNWLFTLLITALFFTLPVKAQVTVGSSVAPQKFSILELISSESGLRLPQLTTIQRNDLKLDLLTDPDIKEAAKGLVIYNIDTGCIEFWNGDKWVSLCGSVVMEPDGSPENPYLVCTPAQLDDMRSKPDVNYKLCADIDLTEYIASKVEWGSAGWEPIGKNSEPPFTGSFDGAGYTISGLWIYRPAPSYGPVGLFGVVNDGGTVKNLKVVIDAKNINAGINTYVGGVVGHVFGDGSVISNCCVTGGTIVGGNSVGGVAGRVDIGNSSITGCYASVDVKGANGIGGVVGQVSSETPGERGGSLTNSYATGNITGNTGVGGVTGRVNFGAEGTVSVGVIMSNCYATGMISRSTENESTATKYLGGVVGRFDNHGTVSNCVALNSGVSTTFGYAAFVGRISPNKEGSSSKLINNWALENMVIKDSSGSAKSPLDNTANGLDGADVSDANSKTENWWKTTSSLGWDWTTVWTFDTTISAYPILKWQAP